MGDEGGAGVVDERVDLLSLFAAGFHLKHTTQEVMEVLLRLTGPSQHYHTHTQTHPHLHTHTHLLQTCSTLLHS